MRRFGVAGRPAAQGRTEKKRGIAKWFQAFGIVLLGGVFLASCGGGGSSSSSSSSLPPPQPYFAVSAKPSSLSISPNTTAQIKLSLTPMDGFSGDVTVNLSGLPSGVTSSSASPFTLPATGLTLTLTADSSVADGKYTLKFDATSGKLSDSASVSLTVEPLASFTISLVFSNLIVRQGGSVSGFLDVSVGPGSTNFTLTGSVQGLPSGVTASFAPSPFNFGQQVTMTLTATSAATITQNDPATLTVTRNFDSATQSANFTVAVAQPPGSLPANRTNFVRTDDTPTSVAYDPANKLVYAALPDLSRVDVINPAKNQVVQEIPVPDAQGLSVTPDGTRVLVSGFPQQVAWIDAQTGKIVRRDVLPTYQDPSCSSCPPTFVFPGAPIVMASGKVLFLARTTLGNALLEWDPSAPGQIKSVPGLDDMGVRSADGSKALLYSSSLTSGSLVLFDSATDSIAGSRNFSTATPAAAANPDGTQFAVAVYGVGTYFLDDQFNTVGIVPVGGAATGMAYSPDGKYLYVVSMYGVFPVIWTVDTSTFQVLGQAPAYASNIAYFQRVPPLVVERPMAADSTGMLFGIADHGVALDDSTDFRTLSLSAFDPIWTIIATPDAGPQGSATPVTITTQGFTDVPDVWFGGLRGTNLSLNADTQAQATAPPSSTIGPVNVKVISADGTEGNIPDAYTYGVYPIDSPTLAASPSGGPIADLFGYGFGHDSIGTKGPVQVQIGGAHATINQSILFPGDYAYPFPLDDVRVAIPPGSPGAADIHVTSTAGSAMIAGGFHYVQSVTDYPSTDTFQFVLYDPKRQQAYLSAGDHIDVFSLAGHAFLTPITPPTLGGQRQFGWLALTPDDSELLAANLADDSVAIINPDNASAAKAIHVNGLGGTTTVVTTSNGLAFVGGSGLYQINLSTLQVTLAAGSSGFLAAARDGSTVLSYTAGDSGGAIYAWTAASGTWTLEHFTDVTIFDGTVSGNGNVLATNIQSNSADASTTVDFFDPQTNFLGRTGLPEYLYARPALDGMKLNDTGSLAYVPALEDVPLEVSPLTENAVDIYDVRNNRLRERVLLSEQFPATALNAMDIDPTGKNIFLTTNAGLTVVTLDSVPLSIGTITPNPATAGATVTLHGSGFVQGTTATFNGTAASVTFVNADTLQATIPAALASGPVAVKLANPDGSTYTLDDAFTIN